MESSRRLGGVGIRVSNWARRSAMAAVAVSTLTVSFSATVQAFPVDAAEAPSTTLELTATAIRSATRSVQLNIYEFSSSDIADALLDRIRAGIKVDILEEGQPVGGVSTAARGIQAQLVQAMRRSKGKSHLYEMTSKVNGPDQDSVKRRFRFNHGKYAVIDGKRLLIGSENYSPTGHPLVGTKGNRGWEVLLHEPTLASDYAKIFRSDIDLDAGDVVDLTDTSNLGLWMAPFLNPEQKQYQPISEPEAPGVAPYAPWSEPSELEADSATIVTSPETSLSGLTKLMRSAKRTLDIEQMTFSSVWGKEKKPSPLFQEVVAAARRGVRVRVLLNDERVFAHPTKPSDSKNLPTIDALNRLAASEGLDVEARTAQVKRMGVTYIHNKGALVDGEKTLISSINWDQNSVIANREAAVVIRGAEVHDHYATLFESDWKLSRPSSKSGKGRMDGEGNGDADTLTARANREVGAQSLVCPDQIHVSVTIGELVPEDYNDPSFSELANSTIDSEFVRTPGGKTCLLTDTRSVTLSRKSRFIEIRKRADGNRSATLEGYTDNGKLYSIRTVLGPQGPYDGDYNAFVYDGSGPSRRKMGEAVFELETLSVGE